MTIALFFCSNALTSTGWVRSTIKLLLHCPLSKQYTLSIILYDFKNFSEIISEKILGTLRIEPGAAGREVSMLSTVLCGVPQQ